MICAIWIFCGLAICYNNMFSTAIIHFQLLLYKHVKVQNAILIYTKSKIGTAHSFYGKLLYILSMMIAAHNSL